MLRDFICDYKACLSGRHQTDINGFVELLRFLSIDLHVWFRGDFFVDVWAFIYCFFFHFRVRRICITWKIQGRANTQSNFLGNSRLQLQVDGDLSIWCFSFRISVTQIPHFCLITICHLSQIFPFFALGVFSTSVILFSLDRIAQNYAAIIIMIFDILVSFYPRIFQQRWSGMLAATFFSKLLLAGYDLCRNFMPYVTSILFLLYFL